MAHIFRKIRAFIDAYPQYRSILTFYLKLRKIIRDGEKLQAARAGLDEMAFRRRLKALERRLDELLKWKNPNDVLKEVIKKVRRQKAHILTFVNHDGASHHNNYGEYNNPEIDAILEMAGAEPDCGSSLVLYQQAEQELVEDAACLPLWFGKNHILAKSYVKGYNLNLQGLVMLNNVSTETR